MTSNDHPFAALAAAALMLLAGCDKMRSTEPPPSFESPTVGVAREIGAAQETPRATPASAAAGTK